MSVNKVVYGDNTLIDLTGDTVTAETLAEGVTAHDSSGEEIVGEAMIRDNIEPTENDIPKVFFGSALPQTKTDIIMPFRYISKTMDINAYCKIKAQGQGSMAYPKKNQTVKLYTDSACSDKLKVNFKGWGEQSKFCFKANWIDITHARNIVSARLWGDIVKSHPQYDTLPELLKSSPNQGAVDGFPVKVYAGGEYQGRYTINIPKDAWMANMDDELDTHCILCMESNEAGCFRAEANIDGTDITDEIHDIVPDAIKTRWNEIVSFVMNSADDVFISGISDFFDVDSLVDYYLFGLAICGLDNFSRNQLFMTYNGQKWYPTMYDLDATFGLLWNGTHVPSDYSRTSFEDFVGAGGNLLYLRLESLFTNRLKNRWWELRENVLKIENIINRFERFTDITPPWLTAEDYANTTANGAFVDIPSIDTNTIQYIRQYAIDRLSYIDDYITMLGLEEDDYTIIQYIESSGSQYIDTGISGGTNAAYEITIAPLSAVDYGTYTGGHGWEVIAPKIYGTSNMVWVSIRKADGTGVEYAIANTLNEQITIRYNVDGDYLLTANDVSTDIIYGATLDFSTIEGAGWGSANWWIFNNSIEQNLFSSCRLYGFKMWTDGVLVRNFVPVRREVDGVYGLYDTVTSTFFGNRGTGELTGA